MKEKLIEKKTVEKPGYKGRSKISWKPKGVVGSRGKRFSKDGKL